MLLLSRDDAYRVRQLVTIAPVTTRVRDIPVEVDLGPDDGLDRACVVNLDSITTVPIIDLDERITSLSVARVAEVEQAIHFALGLEW